jgi:hypothetical protein
MPVLGASGGVGRTGGKIVLGVAGSYARGRPGPSRLLNSRR